MIESAPSYKQDDSIISLMVSLQLNGTLKAIQDEYLYWDKVKYKSKDINPVDLWNAVKLHRKIKSNAVTFGQYRFFYVVTDYLQRALHQFDMHIE